MGKEGSRPSCRVPIRYDYADHYDALSKQALRPTRIRSLWSTTHVIMLSKPAAEVEDGCVTGLT